MRGMLMNNVEGVTISCYCFILHFNNLKVVAIYISWNEYINKINIVSFLHGNRTQNNN